LISDALVIEDYYKDTYGRDSTVIAYGHSEAFREEVELKAKAAGRGEVAPAGLNPKIFEEGERFLAEFGLKPFEYFLYVSRLEPENNAHTAIEAHAHLDTDKPLLIVGDAPYATEYKAKLKSLAGENVKFAGFRFGTLYHYLQLFCHSYIQATEVGGTHPALVEAMGFSSAIAANDTPEHREVLGSRGCFYDFNSVESLARVLKNFDSDPRILTEARVASFERARSTYSWPAVLEAYETLLFKRS